MSKSISWQLTQEIPRHSLQESAHFKPCSGHENGIVSQLFLQLQQTLLNRFGGTGGFAIVTGIILPF